VRECLAQKQAPGGIAKKSRRAAIGGGGAGLRRGNFFRKVQTNRPGKVGAGRIMKKKERGPGKSRPTCLRRKLAPGIKGRSAIRGVGDLAHTARGGKKKKDERADLSDGPANFGDMFLTGAAIPTAKIVGSKAQPWKKSDL